MNRNPDICDICVHYVGDGFCRLLDDPVVDSVVEDILWAENEKILSIIASGLGGSIHMSFDRPKVDRKLDNSCPYILEHVVMSQKKG